MKTTICRSSGWMIFLAGALAAPAPLSAQQAQAPAPQTHVVRAGETLWSLAQRYLGDGHRWREILQSNPSVVAGPQQLPVGATIVIPGASIARPRVPAAGAAPENPAAPARDPSQMSAAERELTTDDALLRERTLFYTPPLDTAGRIDGVLLAGRVADTMPPARAVRRYEALAAPFVSDSAQLASAGRCAATTSAGERPEAAARRRLELHEVVAVVPPRGGAPDTSTRFLLVRDGPVLEGVGPVVRPTGVVRVTRTAPTLEGEVVAQFDVMSCADRVFVLDLPSVPPEVRPRALRDGPQGRVLWIEGDALLPTLQHRLIVDLGTSAGVRPGDQLTVMVGDSAVAGPREAAIATVVRAGPRASSALIIRQSRPGIAAGMRVQVTAKLP